MKAIIMTLTVPALPAELPPHHRPVPRILAALAVAAVVTASTVVGVALPAAAEGDNVAPVAVDDSYVTTMSTQLVVGLPGIFANDIDPDSNLTLFSVDKTGVAGTVFVNNNGTFTYNPTPGFTGQTSFQYRVGEVGTAQFSAPATVTITVEAPAVPNALPVTVADTYTTPFEMPLVVSTSERLLLNDSDADGDPIVAVSNWVASVGALSAYADQGTFTFTPPAGFSGDATFTYYAFDHKGQGNTVTVTITVLPEAPQVSLVANNDAYPVVPGQQFSVLPSVGLLSNDTHSQGAAFSLNSFGQPQGVFSMQLDGAFTWQVPSDFCDATSFVYDLTDGSITSNLATVTLTAYSTAGDPVTCDNTDPVPVLNSAPVAVADEFTVKPGETLTVPAASGVLVNDSDADGDPLTVVEKSVPGIGSGFALAVDGALIWTAPADFCDEVTFSYAALDGQSESDSALVTIRAIGVKDWELCPDAEEGEEEPISQPGSPTVPTLPLPTDPGTPGDEPELSDAPATPGRDTLAYTGGAGDLAQGIGWGALLAIMLGLGLTVSRARRGAGA